MYMASRETPVKEKQVAQVTVKSQTSWTAGVVESTSLLHVVLVA